MRKNQGLPPTEQNSICRGFHAVLEFQIGTTTEKFNYLRQFKFGLSEPRSMIFKERGAVVKR